MTFSHTMSAVFGIGCVLYLFIAAVCIVGCVVKANLFCCALSTYARQMREGEGD